MEFGLDLLADGVERISGSGFEEVCVLAVHGIADGPGGQSGKNVLAVGGYTFGFLE